MKSPKFKTSDLRRHYIGTSLVVQQLTTHLAMQETQDWTLDQELRTHMCLGALEPHVTTRESCDTTWHKKDPAYDATETWCSQTNKQVLERERLRKRDDHPQNGRKYEGKKCNWKKCLQFKYLINNLN